jgi:hypothetical protein
VTSLWSFYNFFCNLQEICDVSQVDRALIVRREADRSAIVQAKTDAALVAEDDEI